MNFSRAKLSACLGALTVVAFAGCGKLHNAYRDAQQIDGDIKDNLSHQEKNTELIEIVVQKPILTALLGDEGGQIHEPSLQETVADALARIGNDAVPSLIAALDDRDPEVRSYACRALSVMGDRAAPAVPALIKRLSDEDENVRRSAARALGQVGPGAREAIPALIELMRHKGAVPPPANQRLPAATPSGS